MNPSQTPEPYDVLVLGSGEAGKYLAWTLASAGKRTALVERQYIGGSCPNIACLPSKNFVHSAKVAHYAAQAAAFGLPTATGPIDMSVVRGRKRAMVDGLVDMHLGRFKGSGAELILGAGAFIAPKTLVVATEDGQHRTLTAETVILSTGSRATVDDLPGLREAAPLTHIDLLEIGDLPRHLVILGAGYIGLEFAQAMRRFGSDVTVIDRNDRILNREDEDVSAALMDLLTREGIRFALNTQLHQVAGHSGESVTLTGTQSGSPFHLSGTHLLVAAGRTPNTEEIGLDLAGITLRPDGTIAVDEHLRTSAPGVFAVGDCAGSPQFTHIAFDDFRIVRETLAGRSRSTRNRQVPYCLFTDPELAHVGLSETQATQQGIPYRLAKLPMSAVLRTRTMDETGGFLKALISATDDTILGFTALGVNAGELLAPVQLAMAAGLSCTSLRDLIITHPTITEGLVYLFATVPPRQQT